MHALLENPTEMANPGWVFVAIAAGVLGIALLILARVRRFQARPLRICFVLSIFAHVLLLAVFYVSRVFEMPYIPGSQTALIVQLSFDEFAESPSADVQPAEPHSSERPTDVDPPAEIPLTATTTPIPVLDSEPAEPVADTSEQVPTSPLPLDSAAEIEWEAPELLEPATQPVTTPGASAEIGSNTDERELLSRTPAAADVAVPSGSESPDLLAIPDLRAAAPGDLQSADQADDHLIGEAAAANPPSDDRVAPKTTTRGEWQSVTSTSLGIPRRYHDRLHRPTGEKLKQRGGSPRSERAVEAALQWLARNQAPDGRWDAAAHGAGRGGWIEGQHRGSTGLQADTGITGLALLAFLAAGNTHESGDHQQIVGDAIHYLLSQQSPSGSLGGEATIYAQMYCHGIATLAMCEALAMTGDKKLKAAAQGAIDYTIASQDRRTGGWRYRPSDPGDTSQFGWQLMGIVSAREANLDVPPEVDLLMRHYLDSVQSGATGGLAGYRPRQGVSRSMTAEALSMSKLSGSE